MHHTTTLFHRACLGSPIERVPVWLMRQAGRYMKEYQEVRQKAGGFLELCKNPELSAQATLDAARILNTDAAIIFSDITLPAHAMGVPLEFAPGPRFTSPVRDFAAIRQLKEIRPERDLDYVLQAIHLTRSKLPDHVSLIGFVGAPLTLAGYMIQGTPDTHWLELKKLAYGEPKVLDALLNKVTEAVTAHAKAQIEAGCDVVQLFDTAAGELAANELHHFAFGYARRVIQELKKLNKPIIYFARNIGAHIESAADLGANVLGIDWTITIGHARRCLNNRVVLMGNLDPAVLLTNPDEIARGVQSILGAAKGLPSFILNLGHGVLQYTPPAHAAHFVKVGQSYKW